MTRMADHHFNPALAQIYGVDVAVFLHNIYFWLKHNKAYEKNFYEGRYWTFNSLAAFCEAHPYWSRRQIERIIAACKKNSLLLTGCFNQDRRDRTSWYSLSDKALAYFAERTTEAAGCISPFGEMHNTERGQSFHQTGTPLPDINPDNSQTDNPPQSPPEGDKPAKRSKKPKAVPTWQPEKFEGFWKAYPRDEDRAKAVEQWDKLPQDKDLMDRYGGSEESLLLDVARGLKRHLESREWRENIGIPYAFRWIRDRKWTEKYKRPFPPAAPPAALSVPSPPRRCHTEIINGEEVVIYDESA